jgi:hypothetical protein
MRIAYLHAIRVRSYLIIEFAGLADDNRARAYNQYLVNVLTFWHWVVLKKYRFLSQ